MTDRPRNIANDILDAVETATSKWTRQKKSEERHPGMIRYRTSRMTREPRTTQKEAAGWSKVGVRMHSNPENWRMVGAENFEPGPAIDATPTLSDRRSMAKDPAAPAGQEGRPAAS
jgi:hypothetical protein